MNKEESDLIIAEQNKSTEEILKAVAKVKSDYKELCNLKDMRIAELEKDNAELDCQKNRNKFCYSCANATERCFRNEIGCPCEKYKSYKEENAELKAKVGLSIDCENAQKNGKLCLGYGGDEDEPCERCKNCIKCEGGYYQLGETEKDDQLTKAKEIIEELSKSLFLAKGLVRDLIDDTVDFKESKERAVYCYKQEKLDAYKEAEQFLSEVEK